MKINDYIQTGKGAKERELLRLTGKSQMRIGKRLKQKFAGLTREQMAERLIEKHEQSLGSESGDGHRQQFVVHAFTLRPGRTARFELPADLTLQEAEKLTKFIQILPANAE